MLEVAKTNLVIKKLTSIFIKVEVFRTDTIRWRYETRKSVRAKSLDKNEKSRFE